MNCQRVRGEKLLLGEELNKMLQLHVNKTREGAGGGVTTRVVMVAAEGLCLADNRNHIHINRSWAQSFIETMGFMRKKATTSKSKNVEVVKEQFL